MLQKSLNFLRTPLITTAELTSLLASEHGPRVRIVSSTLTRPLIDEEPDFIFNEKRIPNATFIDVKNFNDTTHEIESMIPQGNQLVDYLKGFDIRPDDIVVAYDDLHIVGAARFWFILNTFGLKAYVLDGGPTRTPSSSTPAITQLSRTTRSEEESSTQASASQTVPQCEKS